MNESPREPTAQGAGGGAEISSEPHPSEAVLRAENDCLRRRVAELEAAQARAQRNRIATLNVMEDAVAAQGRAEEATEALRTSEEQKRLILESARDHAIFTLDLDRRVTSWNAGAHAIFGYSEEEILGRSGDVIFTPEDRAKGDAALETRQAADRGRAENERWHQRKDGTRFYGSGLVHPIGGKRGTVGFVKIMRDLTPQKRAEEAQRRAEGRQTFLLKLSDALRPLADPAVIQTEAMRVLGSHLRVLRAQYWEATDPQGEYLASTGGYAEGVPPILHPVRLEEFGSYIKENLGAGRTLAVPDVWLDPRVSESERAAYDALGFRAFVAIPLVKNGRLMAVLGLHHSTAHPWSAEEIALAEETADRTWAAVERVQAEEALRASEERMRTLADAVPQIIWTNRKDGAAEYFNRRWYEYSGLSSEESFGAGWQAIVHPEDMHVSREQWREALAEGKVFDSKYRLRGADGNYRWFITRNVPLRNAAGEVTAWVGTATDVHDSQEAEAALRGSEEQFRRAIEEAPIPVIMQAEDGQVLQISRTWTELTGYRREDIPTFEAWLNRAYGPSSNAVREYMHQLFRGERVKLEVEIEVETRAGQRRYWAFRASAPGALRDGRRFIVGMALDVSERKAAENAIRESEERVRIAVESAKMGTWEWDLPEHRVVWNDLHFKLLGMAPRPNPISESAFFDHIHPEDRDWLTDSIRRSVADHGAFEATFRVVTDRGAERWMNGYGKVTRREKGRIVQMSGVMLDITEQRHAELALRESEERLRLVVENAREYAIFSMTLDRVVLSWNSGATHILGYAPEEVIGSKGDLIFTPEDNAAGAPETEASNAIREGRAADERWHVRKDGRRFWGSGVMMAMHDERGTAIGLVKIFRDHTEQMEAQQALERSRSDLWHALQDAEQARAQAEAAGKAKDHFLAVLSHELRTPLTPVLMAARMLGRDPTLSPAARESLAMIERNIRLESSFIEDLLDLTRIAHGKLEIVRTPLRLHEIVRHAAEVALPDLQAKQQRLELQLAAGHDRLLGDAGRLQQVFWNLLKNASKFAPAETVIRVRSCNEPSTHGEPGIQVQVIDEGIGFDADASERIFDAFAQASHEITREFGGLGLGLSISQASVTAHGGTIRAASRGRNQGATFTVRLPLFEGEG